MKRFNLKIVSLSVASLFIVIQLFPSEKNIAKIPSNNAIEEQ
ncbi:MAG: hypothetical protein ACOH2A_08620 [Sphingobacteriaceae bacterium]